MKQLYSLILLSTLSIMQITAQCTFIASSQATGNSTGVSVNKPVGVVQNHVMIAAIHVGWCNSGSSISAPLGWTLIAQTSNTGSGCGPSNTTIQLATFYKVAGPAEPMIYAFTGSTNQFYVGGIVAYSGVNIVTPINASSNNGAQDACAALVANSVTTTVTNSTLIGVFFCSVNNSLNNIIPPNSMTERVDVGTTGNHPWGNENLEMADQTLSSSGPTGNRTAGLSGCSSIGWVTGAQLIALTCGPATGLNDQLIFGNISISPNPSSGLFDISLETYMLQELLVYDQLGRSVWSENIAGNNVTLDLSTQPKGIYFLKIVSTGGISVQKIVVQ